MLALAASGLSNLDWLVLAGYVGLLIGTGIFFSLRQARSTDEYYLGGHRMPVWAVAFSILATSQSAATFSGAPEQSYRGDLSYLATNLGGILAAFVLATLFIPIYYRLGVTTPYQLLETRFGAGAKVIASLTYMIGRVFAGGARLFIGALGFAVFVFGDYSAKHILLSVGIFTLFGILYTLWGGISSVIWTDVIQVGVYLGATIAAIIVLYRLIPASGGEIIDALRHPISPAGEPLPSKLTLLRLGFDFSKPHWGFDPAATITLLTVLFGFTLITLASHGADQDLVQRMLTCKSPLKGSLSVISGVLIGIPTVFLFLVQGLLLYIFYQRPDMMGAAAPADAPSSSNLVMSFAANHMHGGLAGLMLAGLLAAGPCGINSSLNAMSSTFVSDVYRPRHPGRGEDHYLRVGRFAVIAAGIVVGLFAGVCHMWYDPHAKGSTLIDFALGVMSFAYAGLLAVFFTALFTRRGSLRSCIASIGVGFIVVLLLQTFMFTLLAPIVDPLLHGVGMSASRSLAEVRLAPAWQLVIGTIFSLAVCLSGKRPPTPDLAPPAIAAS